MSNLFSTKPKMKSIFVSAIIILMIIAQVAAKPAWVGNIIANSVPGNFGSYWNQVTSENAGKWGSVESSRDSMNWGTIDTHVNYCKNRGIPFKFHVLVWGQQQPGWIGGLSASEQLGEITEWMQAVAARYTPDSIDVVNEPLHAVPNYNGALGGNGSTGWDWIIKAFQMARQYFPNSKLLINEYGIINDSGALSRYATIINLLKSRGLVDGVGIQCHQFNIDTLAASTMQNNLNTLANLGLPIYVSELDITGDDNTQRSRYVEKFPILYNHSSVAGITLWGYIQGQTWKDNTHLVSGANVGASERPAMQWLKQQGYLLNSGPTSTPTATSTPTKTATPASLGDVDNNGTINIVDALKIAQYYVGLNPTGFDASRANVNCDGTINIIDALIVAQYYVGLVTSFC